MEYTKQDYKNAIGIFNDWSFDYNIKITFADYIEEIIDELKQPKTPMYKCIQLPPANNGMFKIGNLYADTYWGAGLCLSDLPNHFELDEPETKPEKITWEEVRNLIYREINTPRGIEILKRIKTDHLS